MKKITVLNNEGKNRKQFSASGFARRILCLFVLIFFAAVCSNGVVNAKSRRFADVSGNEYYAEAAESLAELGIVSGYFDGSFGADRTITRAEMATIICRMTGDNSAVQNAGSTFCDVNKSHWASGYIERAYKRGIINGDGNGKFRPEDSVLFDEAVKMVVCASGLEEEVKKYSSDWSRGYIDLATDKGFLRFVKGFKGSAASRGDIAVMVYNAMTKDIKAPTASLKSGSYVGAQTVRLTTETEGADIYYTINGKDPYTNGIKYKKPIKIDEDCTLQAITVKNGNLTSGIIIESYIIGEETYSLTMEATEGGMYRSVEGKYKEGEEIYLEATPNYGYEFGGWSSDNGGSFSNRKSNECIFTMPDGDVTISVSFIMKKYEANESSTKEDDENSNVNIEEEKEEEAPVYEEEKIEKAPTKRVSYYNGSVIPKYESITGSPQVVAALSFNQYDATLTRYFYNSNEKEKDEYIEYLYANGWTLNGTSTGGDSRGKSEQSGFSYKDSNGNTIAQVEIDFFPDCGDVDIVCVVKAK